MYSKISNNGNRHDSNAADYSNKVFYKSGLTLDGSSFAEIGAFINGFTMKKWVLEERSLL
jgi:hypothetical protein